MAIAGPEGHLLFVSFLNFHLIVGIGQVELDELLSLAWSIEWFFDQK